MADNVNKLLIAEHDAAAAVAIGKAAKDAGFAVATAASGPSFVQLLESFHPSLIVLAADSPDIGCADLLTSLAARACTANVLLVGSGAALSAAHDLGVRRGLALCGALEKPLAGAELTAKLSALLHRGADLDADDLRRGIAGGELTPHFQPKVSRAAGGWIVDGVEVLARWQHPRLGLVLPNRFIPLAERTGIIADVTSAMLNAALRQLRVWQDEGLHLSCAVNLPPGLVTDSSFPDRVAAALTDSGVDGKSLVLELTETATIQNPTTTMAILTRLRVKGIGLSLDDFGTGYSSLTQLFEMPFSEMKIDKSLVMNMPQRREATMMIGSLIELAHNLGLKVCAEGVENREALDALASMKCDRCQGYFISRAIPAAEVASFATRWNQEWSRVPAKSRSRAGR
jgi:EAL domain-containing protein (putative c-di-GMP-specific phosphodiesterase class I)/CheY-like chemotaxis protein